MNTLLPGGPSALTGSLFASMTSLEKVGKTLYELEYRKTIVGPQQTDVQGATGSQQIYLSAQSAT